MKRNKLLSIIILLLAFVSCGRSGNGANCCCDCERRITADVMQHLSELSDYAYVDWNKKQTVVDMMGWQHPSMVPDFPMEEAQRMYVDCRNLKVWVHHVAVPLRCINGARVNKAIDDLESGFDTLYVRFVSQDYYLRERQEVFNGVIPALLDSLVVLLTE